ncbi:MAG: NAD(P)(+) transhydrogenase (Re/Si-specific) subunit beta [Candidatus Eisenbacteria bacterium]|nr:NAD(P)(+) transhydrogenase (Re/Si-specific) subunit beta [Candidatus Eisenbacteria bacterium]
MREIVIPLAYLVASVLFIVGLKGLTHPRTAVRGNRLGALGMLIAVVAVLFDRAVLTFPLILIGFAGGGAIGVALALRVPMTSMPQLVAVFNGFGGAASALVVGAELIAGQGKGVSFGIAAGLSGLIGAVTFTGSLIAYGKLQEILPGKALTYPGHQIVKILLAALSLGAVAALVADPADPSAFWVLLAAAGALGVLAVLPIGGADMPVVIALLNSYSGLAASATGFVLSNNVLIIAGSLVGASGIILTMIMCKAMNRSLANVLFGTWGGGETVEGPGAEIYEGKIKSTSAEELAMILDGVSKVVIVPGYGLAVAQAQHAVRDLANVLKERGVQVQYAIHPVAGRMPGHMNVLLAEADVPYEELVEMDVINPQFAQTDVSLILGANDVVNPVARDDPKSPIAGMPILDVDKSRTVVVVKRSLSPGFAGIPNPLFAADNTLMFFGDAKKNILDLTAAIKEN